MVTFSGTISTKDGVVKDKEGGKGTIATKKARDKNILTKDEKKEFASMVKDQVPKEALQKQGLLDRLGIATLLSGGSKDRNVTKPNKDFYGKEFKINNVGGFTLESGPFGLGTTLRGPKQRLPEFLQQNEGALLQSALNAQRYGTGNIKVGGEDKSGNPIRNVITLEGYKPPTTAKEFIDNIYQNPNNMVEGILTNNPYFNIMRGLGYAGVDETSPLFQTGVGATLRNRAYESPLIALQRMMGVPK